MWHSGITPQPLKLYALTPLRCTGRDSGGLSWGHLPGLLVAVEAPQVSRADWVPPQQRARRGWEAGVCVHHSSPPLSLDLYRC